MVTFRRLIASTLSALATVTVLTAAPAAASADGVPAGAVKGGMTIVAFDESIARANGYEIRTDEQGRQYSAKVGGDTEYSANGHYVSGNCGWSWVRVNGTGNSAIRLDNGFGVYAPVIAFEWHTALFDNGGVSVQHWGPRPGPGIPAYRFGRNLPGLTRGPILAEVQASSKTWLSNGAVCVSAVHHDTGTVY